MAIPRHSLYTQKDCAMAKRAAKILLKRGLESKLKIFCPKSTLSRAESPATGVQSC